MSPMLLAALLLAPDPPAEPVQRVADVLARGAEAEAAGDAVALADAALALEALGARPAEGEEDFAGRWRTLAERAGVRVTPYRGRALGPAYRRGTLGAGASLATEQIFLAGSKAMVAVAPQAGRTLTIRIAEPGRPICERDVAAPRGECSWLPVFTRRVEIRLANPSDKPARYFLVSN